jgi:hypothetical protein
LKEPRNPDQLDHSEEAEDEHEKHPRFDTENRSNEFSDKPCGIHGRLLLTGRHMTPRLPVGVAQWPAGQVGGARRAGLFMQGGPRFTSIK